VLLPKAKREGMSALYAFCREVDDVADEEVRPVADRRLALAAWREDVAKACRGEYPKFSVNRELKQIIQRHNLPFALFDELIRGVEMDLDIHRYETMTGLEEYCYRVASVVGLLSIEIFGYRNPACRHYADALGKALQLTNILRDVRVDAERGRIYLPLEDLRRFEVREEEILHFQYSERFCRLASHIASRACTHYEEARRLLPAEDRRSMAAAELMGSVYWRLLNKLQLQRFDVFGPEPTRLGKTQKILLILRTWLRVVSGAVVPNYGAR
jgi:phytoene synthase